KSSDIPLEVRAESPWNYYEKSPITFLDLSGEVIIAQEKTSPKKLVGLRTMPKATLTNLQKLRHTNIYFALEAFVANKSTYVVFEEMHLTLEHLVISLAYPSSRQLGTILGQILDGLVYLETENFSHGLLHCKNILVNNRGVVKLGQQEQYRTTSLAIKKKDIGDFGLVTMQLMQKCDPEDGAIRVADPSRWGDHTQAVIQFVSDIPLATSTIELRK
ncbi:hypothetical protein BKA56DRAFT_447812, partial [Ilyonectria sp. MPI-CAGE-AT-0026]